MPPGVMQLQARNPQGRCTSSTLHMSPTVLSSPLAKRRPSQFHAMCSTCMHACMHSTSCLVAAQNACLHARSVCACMRIHVPPLRIAPSHCPNLHGRRRPLPCMYECATPQPLRWAGVPYDSRPMTGSAAEAPPRHPYCCPSAALPLPCCNGPQPTLPVPCQDYSLLRQHVGGTPSLAAPPHQGPPPRLPFFGAR